MAIEKVWVFPSRNGGSFYSYVSLPEGNIDPFLMISFLMFICVNLLGGSSRCANIVNVFCHICLRLAPNDGMQWGYDRDDENHQTSFLYQWFWGTPMLRNNHGAGSKFKTLMRETQKKIVQIIQDRKSSNLEGQTTLTETPVPTHNCSNSWCV